MGNWYLPAIFVILLIMFVFFHLDDRRKEVGTKHIFWFVVAFLAIWIANDIGQQLERQAIAAEQQTKLLQEPSAMSAELGELVKVLKEFQTMAAAESASSPKR